MRDAQTAGLKARDGAGDQPEPRRAPELVGVVEQQLHPEADAEQRQALGHQPADQVREAERVEVAHRLREGAHAREHEAIGGAQLVVVGGDRGARADALERLLDRAAVAHPVVDHGDPGHTSVPLVLGTPRSDGSSAIAARSARASDLNTASITW